MRTRLLILLLLASFGSYSQNIADQFGRVRPATANNKILERFDFGDTGAPTTSGWTPLRGNPAANIISVTGQRGSGIVCSNYELFTGSGGVGSFNNGYQSSLAYKDDNNITQYIPESVMLGIWGDFSNTGKGLILTNVPAGSYKIRLFASLRSGIGNLGPVNNVTTAWEVSGATTTLTDGTYNYYLNADDTVDGVIITVSPNVSGEIRIKLFYGVGNTAVGIINALEIREL